MIETTVSDKCPEIRFTSEDLSNLLKYDVDSRIAASAIELLGSTYGLHPSNYDETVRAMEIYADGFRWRLALELYNDLLGTLDNGSGLAGSRSPTEIRERINLIGLERAKHACMLALRVCLQAPRPLWGVGQAILETMGTCGAVSPSACFLVLQMTSHDAAHYETITTFMRWVDVLYPQRDDDSSLIANNHGGGGSDANVTESERESDKLVNVVIEACVLSKNWTTLVDVFSVGVTGATRKQRSNALRRILQCLCDSGQERIIVSVLDQLGVDFVREVSNRRWSSFIATAMESHLRENESMSVIRLSNFTSNFDKKDRRHLAKLSMVALQKSEEWEYALKYFYEMRKDVDLCTVSYEAALSACAALRPPLWREASDIFRSTSFLTITMMDRTIQCWSSRDDDERPKFELALELVGEAADAISSGKVDLKFLKRESPALANCVHSLVDAAVYEEMFFVERDVDDDGVVCVVGPVASSKVEAKTVAIAEVLKELRADHDAKLSSATMSVVRRHFRSTFATFHADLQALAPCRPRGRSTRSRRDMENALRRVCDARQSPRPKFSFRSGGNASFVESVGVRCEITFPAGPCYDDIMKYRSTTNNPSSDNPLRRCLATVHALKGALEGASPSPRRNFYLDAKTVDLILKTAVRCGDATTIDSTFRLLEELDSSKLRIQHIDLGTLAQSIALVQEAKRSGWSSKEVGNSA